MTILIWHPRRTRVRSRSPRDAPSRTDLALALSRAIGATKAGAIASSAREETAMDLFAEQALWPNIIMLFRYVLAFTIRYTR